MKHDHLLAAGVQPLATDIEIAESQVRLHAIVAEHAAQTYGGGMPPWAQNLQQTLQNMQQTQQNMQQTQLELSAMMRNQRIRSGNTKDQTWSPLLVETTGVNPVGFASALFPANRNLVMGLTGAELDNLEVAYNVPGQFAGPNVRDRRNAFLRYVSE